MEVVFSLFEIMQNNTRKSFTIKGEKQYFANIETLGEACKFADASRKSWFLYASCALKESDKKRLESFELWSFRRLLRIPWTAKEKDKEIMGRYRQWHSSTLDSKLGMPITSFLSYVEERP